MKSFSVLITVLVTTELLVKGRGVRGEGVVIADLFTCAIEAMLVELLAVMKLKITIRSLCNPMKSKSVRHNQSGRDHE
jgi:hypothetical protein